MLSRLTYKVGMVTPSECCVGVCSKGGVFSVGIMPCVCSRMTHWCVRGAISIWVGTVDVDEVWFVVVGVGIMFCAVVPKCLAHFCKCLSIASFK